MRYLWRRNDEINFLNGAKQGVSLDKLLVNINHRYYVFAPNSYSGKVNTPQARNGHIGAFTEKWCKDLFSPIARKFNLYAVNGVVCEELELSTHSSADLAFCRREGVFQKAKDIEILFEIKMGIVNNYVFNEKAETFDFVGDYTTHKGNPSLLRSDSMLKAIGKSVNIRMSSDQGKTIPIIVVGNSPITTSYKPKVDNLMNSGMIQQFMSLYPNVTDNYIHSSPCGGFSTYDDISQIETFLDRTLNDKKYFFSSMLSHKEIGRIIVEASRESTEERIGLKFLELIGRN